MKKIKFGDKLQIHCYKHDGSLHRTWDEATVLEYNEDMIVVANNKTLITRKDGIKYWTKNPTIMFFYSKQWFNIVCQVRKNGICYKCNLASPFLIDDGLIKCIDYDIDIKISQNGNVKILDKNEYKYHKNKMGYSEEIDMIIDYEMNKLLYYKNKKIGPFNKKVIYKYYENMCKNRNIKKN